MKFGNSLYLLFIFYRLFNCDSQRTFKNLEWWQKGVVYQIFPRSFKDSDGDGIGDLKGIEEKADYLKDLGITAVWLSPIFESPMVDFGYDVSNFYNIAKIFGDLEDFISLQKKLDSLNIKLILDFVPNHTSDEHEWFKKSINRIDPYTDYYIWKDPLGWNNSEPIPPNNWVSLFHGPAWKYNDNRKQFYLHQFSVQQPDLNFRNDHLVKEIEKILMYWLEKGVDGFRMDSVAYILEHPEFPDEPLNNRFPSDITIHDSLIHIYSKDWTENYELVERFQNVVDSFTRKDGKPRIVIHEAYTSFNCTMKFYGNSCGRYMPFNFQFITDINDHSTAEHFSNIIRKWLDAMPAKCWPNWVIGNHDNSRIASRFGEELVDGMNMINLLLPGTAITYNGEEIGMVDTLVRWDQTLDPPAINAGYEHFRKHSRDFYRTPFQWDFSTSAGFSTSRRTWLPVNPNYWRLNLHDQKIASRSHFHVYKRLTELRNHPTFQHGELNIFILSKWVLAFTRKLEKEHTFLIIVNLGTEEETINVQNEIPSFPPVFTVHTSSLNSEHEIGYTFQINSEIKMRPKSSLVLTSGNNEKRRHAVLTHFESLLFAVFKIITEAVHFFFIF